MVDVGAAVPADKQSAVIGEPGVGAFDLPAVAAVGVSLSALAGSPAAADHGDDVSRGQPVAVGFGVIAAVGPHLARRIWQPVDQPQQLAVIVDVCGRQMTGQRHAGGVGYEVAFDAPAAPVDRAFAERFAPFLANAWLESTIARSRSSRDKFVVYFSS